MNEEVRFCAWIDCEREFTPRHVNQKYCCAKCRVLATKWAERQKRLRKTEDTSVMFNPVFEFIKKHREETGELLSYGKAVLLMEMKKGRKKK